MRRKAMEASDSEGGDEDSDENEDEWEEDWTKKKTKIVNFRLVKIYKNLTNYNRWGLINARTFLWLLIW